MNETRTQQIDKVLFLNRKISDPVDLQEAIGFITHLSVESGNQLCQSGLLDIQNSVSIETVRLGPVPRGMRAVTDLAWTRKQKRYVQLRPFIFIDSIQPGSIEIRFHIDRGTLIAFILAVTIQPGLEESEIGQLSKRTVSEALDFITLDLPAAAARVISKQGDLPVRQEGDAIVIGRALRPEEPRSRQ